EREDRLAVFPVHAFGADFRRHITLAIRSERDFSHLRVLDTKDGKLIWERKHKGFLHAARLSPDDARLALGGNDPGVLILDAATGAELLELRGHFHQVTHLSFSPDRRLLVSADRDGEVRVWSLDGAHSRAEGVKK
ncbi:MAG TPA: hypothetical protein VKD72_26660, partial [Gemmataceae bacterium]|nr:hypothetical protein [Gemmataceae bacterium]